ncbi:four helix bundle protein [Gracilimonas mengyeensis]|uniref:Four helix bundle protein n=1 Tax=Gracilimonas mengyeensis TaxID=1302730 RepID=A0A521BTY8_9BACT|nr:four helix bundle protein [Gracilimonas mengyeensis]SMO49940.1 four helix bundle protein [Gracilimonas mengyeensis]
MTKITRFEDLNCWQEARILVKEIYKTSSKGKFGKDFGLIDQIRRATVSIMTNIAEGFSRFHRKDSVRFYDFAQSSAAEVQSLLYVAEDLEYIPEEFAEKLREDALHCQRMILSLIKHYNK